MYNSLNLLQCGDPAQHDGHRHHGPAHQRSYCCIKESCAPVQVAWQHGRMILAGARAAEVGRQMQMISTHTVSVEHTHRSKVVSVRES